jgi:UDP-glucose 4-epimerase
MERMKRETWLITGICGFVGRNLVRRLKQESNLQIVGLDNLSTSQREDLSSLCTLLDWEPGTPFPKCNEGEVVLRIGDITDMTAVNEVVRGADVDVIVHLAADSGIMMSLEDPISNFHVNAGGTLNLLEAGRQHGNTRFVMASTSAALGQHEPPVTENHVPRPISPYGAAKLTSEAYCQAYAGSFGMKTCALRFSNVYGPYSDRKTSAVAKFIRLLLAGEEVTIFGDGEQTRDFLFVEDLSEAILAAGRAELEGAVFHVATGEETTINALFAELTRLLEPAGIAPSFRYEPPRAGEILRNYASIEKIKDMLGWSPRQSLADGLQVTVDWFLQEKDREKAS